MSASLWVVSRSWRGRVDPSQTLTGAADFPVITTDVKCLYASALLFSSATMKSISSSMFHVTVSTTDLGGKGVCNVNWYCPDMPDAVPARQDLVMMLN